jgi:hypothetical protein
MNCFNGLDLKIEVRHPLMPLIERDNYGQAGKILKRRRQIVRRYFTI